MHSFIHSGMQVCTRAFFMHSVRSGTSPAFSLRDTTRGAASTRAARWPWAQGLKPSQTFTSGPADGRLNVQTGKPRAAVGAGRGTGRSPRPLPGVSPRQPRLGTRRRAGLFAGGGCSWAETTHARGGGRRRCRASGQKPIDALGGIGASSACPGQRMPELGRGAGGCRGVQGAVCRGRSLGAGDRQGAQRLLQHLEAWKSTRVPGDGASALRVRGGEVYPLLPGAHCTRPGGPCRVSMCKESWRPKHSGSWRREASKQADSSETHRHACIRRDGCRSAGFYGAPQILSLKPPCSAYPIEKCVKCSWNLKSSKPEGTSDIVVNRQGPTLTSWWRKQ
uniref:translation initiation factor IF-2-like isoform X2 n=1 Tax=Callithrix jacchus TaxID=9483 RepID=UPI0023DD33DA|nr:translation initiation factor IF-2-like isoform X2 [Callithrix jacchus]